MADITTVARNCMTGLIQTKKSRCAEAHGPVDLMPMLHIRFATEEVLGLVEDREDLPLMVAVSAKEVGEEIRWVAFLADMLIREVRVEGPTPPMNLGPYSNAQLRDRGDMSISDGLTVSVIDAKTAEVTSANLTYTYDDAGQPRFGAVWFPDEALEGAIIDLLRAAVS